MATKLPIFDTPFETYSAISIIGEGGAGRVYEVKNASGEVYALKCLSAERITAERLKRFRNEISFCQSQQHPNIVKVVDTGATAIKNVKCPFYVMRRYNGTLRDQIGRLNPQNALRAFSQLLDGVEAAHVMGVWHRDLKPENVLWNDTQKAPIVADFGIAHFEVEAIYTAVETRVASRMANFLYAAPEQRSRGAAVDHRADIFALGLILNELFTGEVAQGAGYKRIRDVDPSHGYLDELVEAMIQHNPNKRSNAIEHVKKELIGRKNAFVALQKYDAATKTVIPTTTPSEFVPISLIGLDYNNGMLYLKLSRNVPPGWANEFQSPRGGHSSVMGYGPEIFDIRGDMATIGVRDDARLVQMIVDHAKTYIDAANRGYVQQEQARLALEDKERRTMLEKSIREAELRKNILNNTKF